MTTEVVPCPRCNGTKFMYRGYQEKTEHGRRAMYPYALPCYCELNRIISKQFGMLSQVPVATPEDSEKIHARYHSNGKNKGNYIFLGEESLFFYVVKCYFLNGITHKNYLILEGVNIVDKYNTVKPDGSRLTVGALDQYDMLAILFTSKGEPPTLKACVAEVLKNRQRLGKATWIYAPSKERLESCREISGDSKPYLDDYSTVQLKLDNTFNGYTLDVSDKQKMKSIRKIQDDLGSLGASL